MAQNKSRPGEGGGKGKVMKLWITCIGLVLGLAGMCAAQVSTEEAEARLKARQASTRPSDEAVNLREINRTLAASVARLRAENADLKAKIARLLALQKNADAKVVTADGDKLRKIKAGMALSEVENIAGAKAVVVHSSIISIPPRVGYFGPLKMRQDTDTLDFASSGKKYQATLTVIGGTVSEVTVRLADPD